MAKQREDAPANIDEPTAGLEPVGTEPETTSLRGAPAETIGGTIGPYKLLDELGEGGMGTVYLAEQDRPVRRRVALKVIKPGLDTAQVIARFEAERQALALMDHANIARVLDANTTSSGRPYFVMELVQGAPITTYCDQHRLTLRERLELFLPVCRAVQHAHQKGIIHRDLKPSNILIAVRDDKPVPKIIDFGIAKATTQRLTERTLYTQYGQLVGTPDYMSPEQAGLGGLDVDTRSDVYSLGAVLYELLCGETPLGRERLRQLDFMAMINTIYEVDPPPPSRRLTDSGANTSEVARRRDAEPHRLAQTLRGELDWIVTKALEKERTRRYESASALAADIERYLNNQPVEACPPSATYRLQKFMRRNRAPPAAAAVIALVLVGGILVSGWQAYRATQAEEEMSIERQAALDAKGKAESLLTKVQQSQNLAESRRIEAEKARKLAEQRGAELAAALSKANDATDSERKARDEIERRLREADALRLAMQSLDARERYPQRALLLAAEAVDTTRRKNEPILSAAHQALRYALDGIGGRPLLGRSSPVMFAETTPDGRWLFTSDSTGVRRWDFATLNPAETNNLIGATQLQHTAVAISPDARWLATVQRGANSVKIYLWDLDSNKFDEPARPLETATTQYVNRIAFDGASRRLLANSGQTAWIWDVTTNPKEASPVVLKATDSGFQLVSISGNGRWAVSIDNSSHLHLWNLADAGKREPPREFFGDASRNLPRKTVFSPDGRWLAVASPPNFTSGSAVISAATPSITIFDLNLDNPNEPARVIAPTQTPFGEVSVHRFTHDSRFLMAAVSNQITFWDLSAEPKKEPHLALTLPKSSASQSESFESVQVLEIDRRGTSLAAITSDGTIFAWKLDARDPNATGALIGRHFERFGMTATLSSSGRWLVTTAFGGASRLWDLWSPDARTGIALSGHDGEIYGIAMGGDSLGIEAGASVSEMFTRAGLGIKPFERWLVSRGADSTLRLWDLAAEDRTTGGAQGVVRKCTGNDVVARNDGTFAVRNGASALYVVDPNATKLISKSINVPVGADWSWSSEDESLTTDGSLLANNNGDAVRIWEVNDERLTTQSSNFLVRALHPHVPKPFEKAPTPYRTVNAPRGQRFNAVAISPHGGWLAARTILETAKGASISKWLLWRIEANEPSSPIALGPNPVFSPDDRWIVAWNHENQGATLSLWDLASRRDRPYVLEGSEYSAREKTAFSADGRWLVTAARSIQLWRLGEGDPQLQPLGIEPANQNNLQRVGVSPDGRWIAATAGPAIELWDRGATGDTPRHQVLHGHERTITALSFSPNDRWLASAGDEGDVRLWDLTADQPQDTAIALTFRGQASRSSAALKLRFSADARWLGASTQDAAYFWPLDPSALLDDARWLAGRELNNEELERYRLNADDIKRERLLRQVAELQTRLEKDPQDVALLRERADLLACAGQYQEAIESLRGVIRLTPDDHWPQYNSLPLLAISGQAEAYRRACESMISQFGKLETDRLEVYERVAKGSLFWAESSMAWRTAARLANITLKKAIESKHWIIPWAEIAEGLAEYRLENYAAALEWAEKGLSHEAQTNVYSVGVPGNQVKAMALAQLGRLDEAKAALAAAKKLHQSFPKPLDPWIAGWHDWYMSDIMFREADALMLAKSPSQAAAGPIIGNVKSEP